MTYGFSTCDRLQAAHSLEGILDAVYTVFEEMLTVVRAHQDPDDAMFVPFVMAATCAASGRDAILFAPSLPPHPRQAATVGEYRPGTAMTAARELGGLCQILETKLTEAASYASGQRDRSACLDAAAQARELRDYLSGSAP